MSEDQHYPLDPTVELAHGGPVILGVSPSQHPKAPEGCDWTGMINTVLFPEITPPDVLADTYRYLRDEVHFSVSMPDYSKCKHGDYSVEVACTPLANLTHEQLQVIGEHFLDWASYLRWRIEEEKKPPASSPD